MRGALFYGWRVVAVCFLAAVFTWGFGVFGASVYLSAVTRARGWPVSLVSSAITVFYLTNAVSITGVGSALDRFGARPVFLASAAALGLGVSAIGHVDQPWQLYAVFAVMGLGYATLSVAGLSAIIAPWFERHQGRSVAMALTGASFGAMVVVPLLVLAIQRFGFAATTLGGGALIVAVLPPLGAVVLRYRRPQELGVGPDGDPLGRHRDAAASAHRASGWTRATAVRTRALWTTAIGFALGHTVQLGFLTHHVKLAEPTLGAAGAGWLISATGLTGLLGRLLLARIADHMEVRRYSAAIFGTQTLTLAAITFVPGAPMLIGASLLYGFCLGQITTLSPIVVRREFGAQSFATIYSVAGSVIQLTSAFGPALYGVLLDLLGGYGPVLGIAAAFELAAMTTVLAGRAPARRAAA